MKTTMDWLDQPSYFYSNIVLTFCSGNSVLGYINKTIITKTTVEMTNASPVYLI